MIEDIQKYIDNLKHYDDSQEYRDAEYNLIRLGVEAIPHLNQAILNHPSVIVRKAIAGFLLFFQDESSIPFLAQALKNDPEYFVKAEVVKALGEIGSEQAKNALFEAFTEKSLHEAQDIVFTLATRFCLESISFLREMLAHKEEWIRGKAAEVILYMKCEKASLMSDLIHALYDSQEFYVRDSILNALAGKEFDFEEQVKVITDASKNDPDEFVRENAANLLIDISKRKK